MTGGSGPSPRSADKGVIKTMSGTAGGGRREARRQGGVTDRPTSPMPPGGRYGSTQAALNVHGRDVGGPTRKEEVYPAQIRRTRQQQTQNQRDEPGLIQRAVGGIGILVLFAVGVTTASYRRTASGQLSGAAVKTTVFDRVSLVRVCTNDRESVLCVLLAHAARPRKIVMVFSFLFVSFRLLAQNL